MLRKAISGILAVIMMISASASLASCSDASDDFKVGAIYIGSQNDTAGYTYAHHSGITKAMEELKIPKENLLIVDNVREDDTSVSNAIDTLAGRGCKIIFGISFGYLEAMAEAAKKAEYNDIIFSHATGYKLNVMNFNNYFGRIYQARYLSGIAAGLKSVALGNNNAGYVAAFGTQYAETCSGINAFALGVQSVNPAAQVHVLEIGEWGNESKEKQLAETLIDTYGCCVIAQHCDSAQPQIVAADKGVFGCGYNTDMTVQAPAAHLTAPIWNWNVYYKLAIETAMNNPTAFMTEVGVYYGGLKEGFVDISPLTANCEADTSAIVTLVKDLIISGEWDVFSGIKLSYTKGEDGNYTINRTNGELKKADGEVVVAAGGASVEDSVIKGSMNYFVEGVVAH